jgi:hypothetical protein
MAKQDANVAEVRYARETSFKVVSSAADWTLLEVATYSDFGPSYERADKNVFDATRSLKKGEITGITLTAGFNAPLMQEQHQDLYQEFFKAVFREKAINANPVTSITTGPNTYVRSTGDWVADGFAVGNLVFVKGFDDAANNGLKEVTAVVALTLTVAETLVADGSPAATGTVQLCGHEFTAGAVDVTTTAVDFAKYTCAGTGQDDFTALGVLPGEWIFVGGGDTFKLPTAADNGWKRVRSVSATELLVDKSEDDMADETPASETLRIFVATRILKNETDTSLITSATMQLERKLGKEAEPQADYHIGCDANTLQFNKTARELITVDFGFLPSEYEIVKLADAGTDFKSFNSSGDKGLTLAVEEDPYNATDHYSRLRLALVDAADEAPDELAVSMETLTISIDNGMSENRALKSRGSAENTKGKFNCSGSAATYMEDMEAIDAVDQNKDCTLDWVLVRSNGTNNVGIAMDLPLVALSNAKPELVIDAPMKLPLDIQAYSGIKVLSTFTHTCLMCFYDYLPADAAE